MGRISIIDVDRRREAVLDMVLLGRTPSHIKSVIMNIHHVGLSTVENDLTFIYKELHETAEDAKHNTIEKHIARYEKIYRDCMDVGNEFVALKALRQKEELLRLHKSEPAPTVNVQINNYDIAASKLTAAEIKEIFSGNPDKIIDKQ
jgi:hypothetical protein